MLSIRDVQDGDVESLIPRIRQSDKDEVAVAGGWSIEKVLPLSVQLSRRCEIIQNTKGDPVAIFGVSDGQPPEPFFPSYGHVWLLGTDDIEGVERRPFIRMSRELIPRVMLPDYRFLHNHCWAGNYQALRWLKWCGFTLWHPCRFGPFNERFFPFYLMNKDWTPPCATQSP